MEKQTNFVDDFLTSFFFIYYFSIFM